MQESSVARAPLTTRHVEGCYRVVVGRGSPLFRHERPTVSTLTDPRGRGEQQQQQNRSFANHPPPSVRHGLRLSCTGTTASRRTQAQVGSNASKGEGANTKQGLWLGRGIGCADGCARRSTGAEPRKESFEGPLGANTDARTCARRMQGGAEADRALASHTPPRPASSLWWWFTVRISGSSCLPCGIQQE
jgi:hypothetical protein